MYDAQIPAVPAADVPQDAYVLDVREPDEWAAGHAEGATHIPMSEVVGRIEELPRDTRVHVMCRVGGRSARVAQYLLGQGRDVVNVDGGMTAWAAAGRPVVTDDGTAGTVL
ncbi:sulfurtransferase [Wenjunlia vitaminophila]|uniref:Sulfurtransferase n=1 Tax=Wenjunlia vitaminophila TaxID=76728 RepID=A0A0T6LNC2_WENVI|nr:rhodanese-like domain-containing protein [Wenjunlia vitaminophila]KRV47356.1 sulfurtransferase [Wenjunlia vitaminophila]